MPARLFMSINFNYFSSHARKLFFVAPALRYHMHQIFFALSQQFVTLHIMCVKRSLRGVHPSHRIDGFFMRGVSLAIIY